MAKVAEGGQETPENNGREYVSVTWLFIFDDDC